MGFSFWWDRLSYRASGQFFRQNGPHHGYAQYGYDFDSDVVHMARRGWGWLFHLTIRARFSSRRLFELTPEGEMCPVVLLMPYVPLGVFIRGRFKVVTVVMGKKCHAWRF
jgi:hypothetical protein